MNILYEILKLYRLYLIDGAVLTFIILYLFKLIFSDKEKVYTSFKYFKNILIVYGLVCCFYFPMSYLTYNSRTGFATTIERMTGPYAITYWVMIVGNLSPILLFIHKFKNSLFLLFIITIWVNISWMLESILIHTTMMDREFSTNPNPYLPFYNEWWVILRGVAVGMVLILISLKTSSLNKVINDEV
ncbi:MAG: hypothetical protein U0V72_12345 [Cytophagales bacterium]